MKVASVSILCQDPRVFFAMEQSGTPCPFEGKIGVEATQQWQKYDKLRPDYNQYVDKLKVIEAAQKEEELKKIELIKKQQENNTTKTN
jgi:inactivated superfamily I helicase